MDGLDGGLGASGDFESLLQGLVQMTDRFARGLYVRPVVRAAQVPLLLPDTHPPQLSQRRVQIPDDPIGAVEVGAASLRRS